MECQDEDQSVYLKAWKWFHPLPIAIIILEAIRVSNTFFWVIAL